MHFNFKIVALICKWYENICLQKHFPVMTCTCITASLQCGKSKNIHGIIKQMLICVAKMNKEKLSGINVRTEYLRQFTCMHASSKTRVILNAGQVRLYQTPRTCRL